jgi:hypothetical protein
VSVGTELNIVQEGVPEVIPLEACYLGWQASLVLVAKARRGGDPGLTVSKLRVESRRASFGAPCELLLRALAA